MSHIVVLIVVSACCVGGILGQKGPDGAVDEMASGKDLHGVALVSVAHVCSFFAMLGGQLSTNNGSDNAKRIAERTMMNTMEQTWPFLLCLWLHAIFVDPVTSVPLGWFYVAMRYLYSIFYGWYGQFTLLGEISTQPNYCVIFWFVLAIVAKCHFGIHLHETVAATSPFLLPLAAFGGSIVCMVLFMGFGGIEGGIIRRGDRWQKDSFNGVGEQ